MQTNEPSEEQNMETESRQEESANSHEIEKEEKDDTVDIELSQSDKADIEDFDDENVQLDQSIKKEKKPEKVCALILFLIKFSVVRKTVNSFLFSQFLANRGNFFFKIYKIE